MAALDSIDIYLEFEPVVKLVCEAINCRFNLMNAANISDRRMPACNLKQISISKGAICKNFEPMANYED